MKLLYKKLFGFFLVTLLSTSLSYGQGDFFNSEEFMIYVVLGLTVIIALLVLLVSIYVLHILRIITEDNARKKAKNEGIVFTPEPSWWSKFSQVMNDSVPLEKEASIELDHSYDGIRELDNHLPPWWKYMAYVSIIFSVIYIFVYHISGTLPLQLKEYENELAVAEELKASMQQVASVTIDENSLAFNDTPEVIESGKKVYEMQCVACHKSRGEGGIGPNLTDKYWIHGGSIKDIFKTVRYGVPDKGMIAWEGVLSLSKINDVTMYINTLKGTNPPNPKAPQGEVYSEGNITE